MQVHKLKFDGSGLIHSTLSRCRFWVTLRTFPFYWIFRYRI